MGPPLAVETHPAKGRCFRATRDVSAGEVLLRARPYVAVPDTAARGARCAGCLLPRECSVQCDACAGFVKYCGVVCRERDRAVHARECAFWADEEALLSGFSEYERDYARLLVRCLVRRMLEQEADKDEKARSPGTSSPSFADVWRLCANVEAFSRDRLAGEIEKVAALLLRFVEASGYASEDKALVPVVKEEYTPLSEYIQSGSLATSLVHLVCKEECNSFGLYDYPRGHETVARRHSYALALYPQSVFFNHSCLPNVGHVTREYVADGDDSGAKNGEMVFYALRPIAEGDEACISYVAVSAGVDTAQRRRELEEVFFFTCGCELCGEEERGVMHAELASVLCGQNGCEGWFVPPGLQRDRNQESETWMCEACGRRRAE